LGAVVALEPAAESRAAQDPEVRETIAEVAAELGHALDHARQIAREARQRRRAEVLAGTLGALLREEDVDDILQATACAVIEVVEADAAAIYLYDEELPVESRAYLVGHDEVIRPHLISAAAYAPSQVPAERRMVETRRAQFLGPGDPWAMTLPGLRERYPYRLLVPVMTANQVLGALYLYRSRPQPFEPADAEAAGELAAEAAVVLEQRRLQRAERRQREILVKVHTLARRLNRASSEQTIAQIAVEECAAAFGTRRASLHLYEPNADRLTIAASIGLPQGYITGTAYVAPGSCASGMAAERRGLVVIDDMRVHPDWERWRPYTDPYPELRAVWSLPLIAENEELLGAISLYFDRPRPASENDQTLFGLIAHQVAVALERALLADRTRELYRASVASLAAAVDAKDPFTHNHSWQVAAYSRRIAQAMGLSPADVEIVELAGLLHDVGKIGIPDRILQK
ncbi:MAG: GAF domain-containing protein, partial [Thermomicrobiaceae bacterium]|nr:GAF domain-containing protein [Thermomicrobiaceae bacterium]